MLRIRHAPYLRKQRLEGQDVDFLFHTLFKPVWYRVLREEAGKLASRVPYERESQVKNNPSSQGTFYPQEAFPKAPPTPWPHCLPYSLHFTVAHWLRLCISGAWHRVGIQGMLAG